MAPVTPVVCRPAKVYSVLSSVPAVSYMINNLLVVENLYNREKFHVQPLFPVCFMKISVVKGILSFIKKNIFSCPQDLQTFEHHGRLDIIRPSKITFLCLLLIQQL